MMLPTSRGLIDDSELAVVTEESTTPTGQLITTKFFFRDELVKIDQTLKISEAALDAAGIGQL